MTACDSDPCYELTFAEKVENGKQIADTDAGEPISNAELLRLDVDVLIPAAVAHAITEEVAEELRADVVVEAANGPTTPADDVLAERDVPVLPDTLANAGGVIVSYLEWVQNRQRFAWTEERVNEELEAVICDAFDGLIDAYEEHGTPNLRTAAYVVAIERVLDASEQGGTWP